MSEKHRRQLDWTRLHHCGLYEEKMSHCGTVDLAMWLDWRELEQARENWARQGITEADLKTAEQDLDGLEWNELDQGGLGSDCGDLKVMDFVRHDKGG